MCAIIGIASKQPSYNPEQLIAGRDAMTHRGPDDAGTWWSKDKCVGLAHRRLAIIDLSSAGHQPMHDISGDITIVFNGEIYNYRDLKKELSQKNYVFSTNTDTEVILVAYKEWGLDCLTKLNGMFSFSLYDSEKNIVFSARDRAGEKPFFYSFENDRLRFSSELKGLLSDQSCSRQIDYKSMDAYLSFGYVPRDLCIIKNVKKLPPAHAMLFDLKDSTLKVWKYWELPKSCSVSYQNEFFQDDLINELEVLLEDSVKRQMNSDVPVGILLSGGVDSSIIAAMATRISDKVKTFTVGFDGYEKYDERSHAKRVADFLGTEHLELNAGKVSVNIMNKLAQQYDEPIADSSMVPTFLVSSLVKEHCTVALGGDGGDELFGGYQHYNRLLWRQKNIDWLNVNIRKFLSDLSTTYLPIGFKGRNWLSSMDCNLNEDLPQIANFFNRHERRELIAKSIQPAIAEDLWKEITPRENDLINRATRMDFHNYLTEDILVKVDRASMLNSLEIRSPILDHKIIEFAYGKIPSNYKINMNQRKILLKSLSQKILPTDFDFNRKQGFSIPLKEWLKSGPWRDFFHDVLYDKKSIFDKVIVSKLFNNFDRGYNNSERLFSLVIFELWRREYSIAI